MRLKDFLAQGLEVELLQNYCSSFLHMCEKIFNLGFGYCATGLLMRLSQNTGACWGGARGPGADWGNFSMNLCPFTRRH